MSDPYFNNKLAAMSTNFLNFSSYANASKPQIFCFSGNAYSFKSAVHGIQDGDMEKFKSLRINITGTLIKNANTCCFYTTLILGSIFLFPLILMCFDWWKRKVNKLYNVQNQGYDCLIELVQKSKARELYLMLEDNFFNRSKAEVIIQMLQNSQIQNFVFINNVGPFDSDGKNFSNFQMYMRPIKALHMRADVAWGNKILI